MSKKICVVTGSRAEYGLLRPLLLKLREDSFFELKLLVTGSHLSKDFGCTADEIEKDFGKEYKGIPIDVSGDEDSNISYAVSDAIGKFTGYFAVLKPDLVVVLGDRYEIFAVTVVAMLLKIPVAHLHGGELTEGAIDDAIRHSITKMSYLHFTACEEYKRRVIQLGEEEARVFNVGALGIENVLKQKLMTVNELSLSINFELSKKEYFVVTYHPVTLNCEEDDVYELIYAMEEFPDKKFLITKANADAGGRYINEIWDKEAKSHPNWYVCTSLGMLRYLSAVKYSLLVLGNSSSGIIEVPALRVPTVNIGDRQKGRLMSASVVNCTLNKQEIVAAINKALSDEFGKVVADSTLLFGDGNTSDEILKIVRKFLEEEKIDLKKKFYDI